VPGQPPSSYQVEFASAGLCEVARGQLQMDADNRQKKFEEDFKHRPDYDPKTGLVLGTVTNLPPKLSAVCVQKNSN
jgi:hypothetical protein